MKKLEKSKRVKCRWTQNGHSRNRDAQGSDSRGALLPLQDHTSYAHLIPIVDGGTTLVANSNTLQLQAGKSQIVSAGPGHACLECQGVYTQEEATTARESPSWGRYLDLGDAQNNANQVETRAPSVISNNAFGAREELPRTACQK